MTQTQMTWVLVDPYHPIAYLDKDRRYLVKTNEDEWGENPYHLMSANSLIWATRRFTNGYRGRPVAYTAVLAPVVPARKEPKSYVPVLKTKETKKCRRQSTSVALISRKSAQTAKTTPKKEQDTTARRKRAS